MVSNRYTRYELLMNGANNCYNNAMKALGNNDVSLAMFYTHAHQAYIDAAESLTLEEASTVCVI